MPAPPSSLIDPAIGHLVELAGDGAGEQPGLLAVLAGVADPRRRRGVRHRLAVILSWAIEDRLHWVRDMDFDEDRSQIRTIGPRVMASLLVDLAITILRLAGAASIAAALRRHARRPDRPLRTIMNC